MKYTDNQQWLLRTCPLMHCMHKAEFQQRLQWLSEGMLRNHLEHVIHYTIDAQEIALYQQYKRGGSEKST